MVEIQLTINYMASSESYYDLCLLQLIVPGISFAVFLILQFFHCKHAKLIKQPYPNTYFTKLNMICEAMQLLFDIGYICFSSSVNRDMILNDIIYALLRTIGISLLLIWDVYLFFNQLPYTMMLVFQPLSFLFGDLLLILLVDLIENINVFESIYIFSCVNFIFTILNSTFRFILVKYQSTQLKKDSLENLVVTASNNQVQCQETTPIIQQIDEIQERSKTSSTRNYTKSDLGHRTSFFSSSSDAKSFNSEKVLIRQKSTKEELQQYQKIIKIKYIMIISYQQELRYGKETTLYKIAYVQDNSQKHQQSIVKRSYREFRTLYQSIKEEFEDPSNIFPKFPKKQKSETYLTKEFLLQRKNSLNQFLQFIVINKFYNKQFSLFLESSEEVDEMDIIMEHSIEESQIFKDLKQESSLIFKDINLESSLNDIQQRPVTSNFGQMNIFQFQIVEIEPNGIYHINVIKNGIWSHRIIREWNTIVKLNSALNECNITNKIIENETKVLSYLNECGCDEQCLKNESFALFCAKC